MSENPTKLDMSFQSLLNTVSTLGMAEKRQLWELLETELFQDEEDSPEDIAEIQVAYADYEAGNYITFEQYKARRVQ